MKIGLLSRFPPERCGIAIYSNNLLKALKKKKVDVVTIGSLGSDADYCLDLGSISLESKLGQIIKKEKLDLLHIQYVAPFFGKFNLNMGLLLVLKLRIPKIVTLHEVQYPEKGLKHKVLEAIEKRIILGSDAIIVHTPAQRDHLVRKPGNKQIECIYMGLKRIAENPQPDLKNILFFGIIAPGKGIEHLIKAMRSLKGYRLNIAGSVGKDVSKVYTESLKNLSGGLNNVTLDIGWVSEDKKDKLFRKAGLVVLPYIWAPYQSAVLHDAFSYGIPVVVTRVGAVWEIVKKYNAGIVVKPGSPEAIAEGIAGLIKNYTTYRAGVSKYVDEALWDNSAKKHLRLYQKVLKHKSE